MKKEEAGLLKAARELGLPLLFFSREQIETIDVPHPSLTVKRHMGVKSVCEAAALLGAGKGELAN
ncbi:MAG: cobalamin biosynthesis protein [Deltaproteobacteria bacterium]|nr:cobalamin biosynthesis protein [Deltaproteobacteria bacterium]